MASESWARSSLEREPAKNEPRVLGRRRGPVCFSHRYLFTFALCYLLYVLGHWHTAVRCSTPWSALSWRPGEQSHSAGGREAATGIWRPGRVSPRSVLADRGSARARAGPREIKAGCDVRTRVPPEHGAVRGRRWAALHVPRVDVAQAPAAHPAEAPLPRRLRRVGVWRGDYSSMILSGWRSGGTLPGEPCSSPTATTACTAGAA